MKITYGYTLIPFDEEDIQEQAPGVDIKALVFPTKKRGNLKFKRMLEPRETTTKPVGKVSKCGVKMHCSNYGGQGYNKKICTQRRHELKVNPFLN